MNRIDLRDEDVFEQLSNSLLPVKSNHITTKPLSSRFRTKFPVEGAVLMIFEAVAHDHARNTHSIFQIVESKIHWRTRVISTSSSTSNSSTSLVPVMTTLPDEKRSTVAFTGELNLIIAAGNCSGS